MKSLNYSKFIQQFIAECDDFAKDYQKTATDTWFWLYVRNGVTFLSGICAHVKYEEGYIDEVHKISARDAAKWLYDNGYNIGNIEFSELVNHGC